MFTWGISKVNKILTVLSFSLAVAAFVYIFYAENNLLCILWFVLALVVAVIGFFAEKRIRKNGNKLFDAIVYFFTPNGVKIYQENDHKYNVEKFETKYSILDNNTYELSKKLTIKSYDEDFSFLEEGFCWSAPYDEIELTPLCSKHTINNEVYSRENYKRYKIQFNQTYSTKDKIEVGSTVRLKSATYPDEFFGITIKRKTKHLVMDVYFDSSRLPQNPVVFKTYSSKFKEKTIQILQCDSNKNYHISIKYPRKGWRYVISWDKKEQKYLTKD